jgi:hypothetical protein
VMFLAPKNRPSETTATIQAKVVDYGSNTAVSGVTVSLATGPSAPASDTSDAGGNITFSGLDPNPTSGPTAYYDLSVTPPAGYVALSDTVSPQPPAHVQLSPTQLWSTVLDIYKPVTIGVVLLNPDGSTFTGNATVTVSSPRPSPSGTTHAFSYTGAPITITTLSPPSGELLVPNLTYSITVTAAGYQTVNDSGTVPSGSYPASLTRTFTETIAQTPGTLNVTVQEQKTSGGTITCRNAPVSVTGGPLSVSLSGQTGSLGQPASFANLTPGGPPTGYTVAASSPISHLSNTVPNVTVIPGPSATSLTVNLGTSSSLTC